MHAVQGSLARRSDSFNHRVESSRVRFLGWFRLFVGGCAIAFMLFQLTGCGREDSGSDAVSKEVLERQDVGDRLADDEQPIPDVSALQDQLGVADVAAMDVAAAVSSAEAKESGTRESGTADPTARELREQALKAFGQGDADLAFELVRKARRRAPQDPEVTFFYAMVLADRHRFEEACKILDQLGEREPSTRLPALGQTAQWMVESARYDEAESRFRAILTEAPDAPILHHQLGMLLFQRGKRTEAAEHFRFLSRLGEVNQEELRALLTVSQPFASDEESGRMIPLSDLARARQRLALGDLDEAMEIVESIKEDSSAGATLKARLLAEQQSWESLESLLSETEIGIFDADGWYASGLLAAQQKKDEKAIEDFCRALLIDPTDPKVYESLGRSLSRTGKVAEAKEASERAATLEKVRELGAAMTRGEVGDRARIAQLVPLLVQLNRPLEALGWQSIDLIYGADAGQIDEQRAQQAFAALGQHRQQLLRTGEFQVPLPFILCGLEPPAMPGEALEATP